MSIITGFYMHGMFQEIGIEFRNDIPSLGDCSVNLISLLITLYRYFDLVNFEKNVCSIWCLICVPR